VQIYDRLRKRIPVPFALKADGYTRNDDPPFVQAAREALVNLLMHMDYFDAKGAVVKCYDDQILFRNAGCLRFPIERIEQHLTEPRNPVIAKVFRLLGWADRSGEGIEKIAKGWTSMGYDKPVFQDDKTVNMFEVIFPLVKKGKNADQAPIKYHASTDQVPCKLNVLQFCVNPHSLKEIIDCLGLKNRMHVLVEYVRPLVEDGLLALTIPDKPKSSRQKYMTTEKGRESFTVLSK
jgi:ATP-dependent DNA helicase RecG